MGRNRRYADQIDARMGDRIVESLAASGEIQTLTPLELEFDHQPRTIEPQPKPVRAWVRFGQTPVRVDAVVCQWTPRAVGIEFEVAGKPMRCWVWASAVERG